MQFIFPALLLSATALAQGFFPSPQQCFPRPLPRGFPPQGSITAQFPNGVNPGVGPTACEQVNGNGYVAEINYRSVDYCYRGQRYLGYQLGIAPCDYPCCKALAAVDGSAGTCVCGF